MRVVGGALDGAADLLPSANVSFPPKADISGSSSTEELRNCNIHFMPTASFMMIGVPPPQVKDGLPNHDHHRSCILGSGNDQLAYAAQFKTTPLTGVGNWLASALITIFATALLVGAIYAVAFMRF
jgi:hypothetical protein